MSREQIQEEEYRFPYHYLPSFYGEPFSEARHLFWGYEYVSSMERIVEILKKESFSSLVDVGCGEGCLLYNLHVIWPSCVLFGIDFSPRAIAFAKAFLPESSNVRFSVARASDISKDGKIFDRFTMIEILEHIPPEEIDASLREIKTLLKVGGIGIVTVPSIKEPLNPKHYQHFTEESLRKTLEPHFKILSIEYLNSSSFFEKVLKRVFANCLFILNSKKLNATLYALYKKTSLLNNKVRGKRVLAIIQKS